MFLMQKKVDRGSYYCAWYNTIFETLKLLVMSSRFLWNETSSCIFESFIIRFFGIACLLQLNV